MSSTNKTKNLKLNQWVGSDIPQRTDFVNDNDIIDKAIHNHTIDNTAHCSSDEKEKWNNPYYITTYTGDGTNVRTLDIGCPWPISWGIVLANGYTANVADFENEKDYQFLNVFSNKGSIYGVSIVSGNQLKLVQSSIAFMNSELRCFNQTGVTYVVIAFR